MPRTSDKAEQILNYVNQFIHENGYAPSVREIGAAVGLRSTASVSYHLQALQEKGLLQAPGAKGRKRAIVTTQRPGQIPVIGVVTAGVPILAYRRRVQLQTAKALLETDNSEIAQIATECGFQDESYFIQVFRKFYGITPAAYRRQKRKS